MTPRPKEMQSGGPELSPQPEAGVRGPGAPDAGVPQPDGSEPARCRQPNVPSRTVEPRLLIAPLMTQTEAAAWVTAEERAEAQRMGSDRRRREWLTWRALVRRELGAGVRIAYDEAGAPVVAGCDAHISVAHCPGRVALGISPNRCAVDIEPLARDCSRAADRFMSLGERRLSDDPLLPLVVWCAKETLYKYAGRKELDLLRDLRVEQVDLDGGTVRARIKDAESLQLRMLRAEDFLIVYIL